MNTLALTQLFLSIVFAISAVTKMLSFGKFEDTIRKLGIPDRYCSAAGILIVAGELAAAVLVLWEPYRHCGGIVLMLLLGSFTWAVWKAMRAGKKLECNCFGEFTSETLGSKTLVRIAVLLSLDLYLLLHQNSTDLFQSSFPEFVSALPERINLTTK